MRGNKYVLLTGATGFIGNAIVEELLGQDYTPILLVRTCSTTQQFDAIKGQLRFITVDFNDTSSLKQVFTHIFSTYKVLAGVIYGLGATKAKNRAAYHSINCNYLKIFHQLLCECGVHYEQFVFISSLTPHGPLACMESIIGIQTSYNPLTYYAESKLQAERFIQSSMSKYIIIRPAAVYGKYDKEMLPIFKMVKKGIGVHFGSKKNKIGVIYSGDLAVMIVKSLSIQGKAIILGCTHNVTVRHYLDTIAQHLTKITLLHFCISKAVLFLLASSNELCHRLLFGRMPMFNVKKVNELVGKNWTCDNHTYIKQLGWQSKVSFNKRMRETVEWYQKNKLL